MSCSDPASGAIVTFAWSARPDTIRVLVNHQPTVAAACAYIELGTGAHIPSGPIARGAGVDAAVPFHFIPDSLRLVEVAIELCDGALMRTAQAVNEYMQGATGQPNAPTAPYCPWGARPVDVQ